MPHSPDKIFAPVVTGIPPCDAHRDLMRLPSGEIRHYGYRATRENGRLRVEEVVLKSGDSGLSWHEETVAGPSIGAMAYSPWSKTFLTVLHGNGKLPDEDWFAADAYYSLLRQCPGTGVWMFRSKTGPDGPFVMKKIGTDSRFHIQRQPLALTRRQRWILPFEVRQDDGFIHPGVMWSDDDGETWETRILPYPPLHEAVWPHGGYRWRQPGCEPVIAEYASGRLHMLLRTSQDVHYECFSQDGGETWSEPAPSRFYSVATMPNLMRLRDGRLLAIWNNTTPLPEFDHALQPILSDDERNGVWEDVFTNRDALHAAISEDEGKSWIGCRELYLNECRNDGDFRSSGSSLAAIDKSVHQTQSLELADGKILVALGQHPRCRKLLLFDVRWLYETARSDDFTAGLDAWSVHLYLDSIPGGFRGYAGHCAFNRRAGAALVPDPDGTPREVLRIARHPDSRLVSEREGAAWNFPAGKTGVLNLSLRLERGGGGLRICLTDRWFNPSDPVVPYFSPFTFRIDSAGRINGVPALPTEVWCLLSIRWDLDRGIAGVRADGKEIGTFPVFRTAPLGISYVHIQAAADRTDEHGALLAAIEKISGE